MSALIAFPLPPRRAAQPAADAMPLRMRVVSAGRWPWASDGNTARLVPPPGWRHFGSHLAPEDARGAGIWSRQNFVRLQVGFDAVDPIPGDFR